MNRSKSHSAVVLLAANTWITAALGGNSGVEDSSAALLANTPETIVYTSMRPIDWDLYLFDSALRAPARRLDLGPGLQKDPAFSNDGQWLVYASEYEGNIDLWALPTASTDNASSDRAQPIQLTFWRSAEGAPALSPDGQRLLFTSTRSGRPELWIQPFRPAKARAAAQEARKLTPQERAEFRPAWHPDGRSIAFSSDFGSEPGHTRIFSFDLENGQTTQITDSELRDGSPRYSYNGARLFFHRANRVDFMVTEPSIWSLDLDASGKPARSSGGELAPPRRVTAEGVDAMVPVECNGGLSHLERTETGWTVRVAGSSSDPAADLAVFF